MKQFDCQEMPDNVKQALFDCAPEEWNNDSWKEWEVEDDEEGEDDINLINNWLISQGCKVGKTVLIKYWW